MAKFSVKNRLLLASAVATIALLPNAAMAQGASQPSPDPQADERGLDQIVVTANRREESLQSVAGSVRAVSGQDAVQMGVSRVADIALLTPGLNAKYASGFENPVFTMRGVGLNDVSAINNPTVGIYVDDVFVPYIPMMGGQVFDVERIEVLKGPQGSLYGRNTTGGAIKFISRRPTDRESANLRADVSSWSTVEIEAAYGGPISDTLKGRVALFTRQRQDGYLYNRFKKVTVGRQDRMAIRGILDWSPDDKFDASLNVHASRMKDDAALREHIGFKDPVTGVITCPAVLAGQRGGCTDRSDYADNDGDPFTSDQNNLYGDQVRNRMWGANLTLNYQLPFATLTSISAYDHFHRNFVDDNDASPFIQFEIGSHDTIKVFSQELRLVSNPSSPFKWVLGAFYSWDNSSGVSEQAVDRLFNTRVRVTNNQTTQSGALFANVSIPLSETFSINGGLRLTRETKNRKTKSEDLAPFGNVSLLSPTGGAYVFSTGDQDISKTDLSGNIGVQFKPSEDLMIYANAAKGFKSGGFKGAISFNPAQLVPYDSETLYAYELGFKSTLFDNTMRFNVAAYYYDWKDFQAYSLTQQGVFTVVVLNNAGDARIKGIEGEIVWRPVPSLKLSVAANYLDAKIVSFNALAGGQNNKGKKLSNAPDFTLATVLRYSAPETENGIAPYFQISANYQSRNFFEIQNNPINSQAAYWLTGLRVGATLADGKVDLALYARNLFNKTYIAESRFIDLRFFPSSNVYGEPRSFGVSASYNF